MSKKIILISVICLMLDSTTTYPLTPYSLLLGSRLLLQPEFQANLSPAIQLALENCQNQFKWNRWNCPETAFSRQPRSTPQSSKEFSYVLSITSAAITYVITRNCTKGTVPNCGCNPNIQTQNNRISDWIWGGCSEYTEYGEEASRKYLDGNEIGEDAVTYSYLHNYGVGREVVRESLRKRCKCHGMSGSCSMKTCWMEMAPFPNIASELKRRYNRAKRIGFEEWGVGNTVAANKLSEMPKKNIKDLVYLEESPYYCLPNNTTGWKGTLGRTCSKNRGPGVSQAERKSCRHLCRSCGHSVVGKKRTITRHCNCSFKWCCDVKCDLCTETVFDNFCA